MSQKWFFLAPTKDDVTTAFEDSGYRYVYQPVTALQYNRLYSPTASSSSSNASAYPKPLPIIIDNGSYECRSGWASDPTPRLRFLNATARHRKNQDHILVGHMLAEEGARLKPRSPFDANVVINFELMEYLLDYNFSSLGLEGSSSIDHPLLLTEAICNPNYSRARMSELLFECYNVPAVCYAVDDLLSFYYNNSKGTFRTPVKDSLVVSSSHDTTHVFPIIGGRARFELAARVPVGGRHSTNVMYHSLSLRYPQHRAHITPVRCQELNEKYAVMSPEPYKDYLNKLQANINTTNTNNTSNNNNASSSSNPTLTADGLVKAVVVHLPFEQLLPKDTEDEKREKEERKRENAGRLKELAAKRRVEKLSEQAAQLEAIQQLKDSRECGIITEMQFQQRIKAGGFEDTKDFLKVYHDMRKKVEKMQQSQGDQPQDTTKGEEEMYPLLKVPDEQLDPEQLKEKKKQKFLKKAAEGRKKKKAEKESLKAQQEELERDEERKRLADPAGYIQDLHRRRNEFSVSRETRKRIELEASYKRSEAKKRMRLLAHLGGDGDQKPGEGLEEGESGLGGVGGGASLGGLGVGLGTQPPAPGAGDDDDEWDVYRGLTAGRRLLGETNSESEEEKVQISKLDEKIKLYDPNSVRQEGGPLTQDDFLLRIHIDRVKGPESVYQPSIIGSDQAGLGEVLDRIFDHRIPPEFHQQVIKNVFVTGGNTLCPNFLARLTHEIRQSRPFGTEFNLFHASDPRLDAWRGAKLFVESLGDAFSSYCVTRADYLEKGAEYLKEHPLSNTYVPSPASEASRGRKRKDNTVKK